MSCLQTVLELVDGILCAVVKVTMLEKGHVIDTVVPGSRPDSEGRGLESPAPKSLT